MVSADGDDDGNDDEDIFRLKKPRPIILKSMIGTRFAAIVVVVVFVS